VKELKPEQLVASGSLSYFERSLKKVQLCLLFYRIIIRHYMSGNWKESVVC
jgi:hypothetical protein